LTFEVSSNQVPAQLPVVIANNVPLEAIEQSEKRPFAALVREAKAATQIAVSFSLNWRSLPPRQRSYVLTFRSQHPFV
jgi:hypothetical protein